MTIKYGFVSGFAVLENADYNLNELYANIQVDKRVVQKKLCVNGFRLTVE